MIVENQRHTTDIVAAYVRHNSIATDQISGLINAVHSTLNGLGNEVVEEPPRVPAVSVRRSVRPDHIICIECGYKGQMLKKHLRSRHGLSVAEYRSRWNLASDYPMTAPNYSERRSQLAKSIPLDRVPARCWNRRAGRCRLIVATAGRAHRDTSTIRSSGTPARDLARGELFSWFAPAIFVPPACSRRQRSPQGGAEHYPRYGRS